MKNYLNTIYSKAISGMVIEIIDNSNRLNSRFTYACKRLLRIPVKQDPSRDDGVYFNSIECRDMEDFDHKPEYATFDEAREKFGIYADEESALTGGSPEAIVKRQLLEKDNEIQMGKRNLELLQQEINRERSKATAETDRIRDAVEKEMMEQKAQVEQLKHRNALLEKKLEVKKKKLSSKMEKRKSKTASVKHRYEVDSYHRKNTSEIIKWAPAALTAVITTGFLINKMRG